MMLDLEMIEEMEALLTEAMTHMSVPPCRETQRVGILRGRAPQTTNPLQSASLRALGRSSVPWQPKREQRSRQGGT